MSWDPVWEEIFTSREWGQYPPEELIRFVARNFYMAPERRAVKILEVGCGPGANVWFLSREGFDTYGIDGSKTAIAKARRRLEEDRLEGRLQVGDFGSLTEFYPAHSFDAVVDLVSMQQNPMPAFKTILDEVRSVLKPGGKVFSMMIAKGSYGDGLGTEVEPGTFVDIRQGPLQRKGLSHFFTLDEVTELFQERFSDVQIEHSLQTLNNQQNFMKHWIVEARRD